jgi:PASTA domain.
MGNPANPGWVVTTATERVTLDSERRAEVTVTVTNLHDSAMWATLAVITEDPSTRGWFSVVDADRVVDAGASVPFVVSIGVPPKVRAAEYAFHAVVRSTGAAENEEGVRSNRMLLSVPPWVDPYKRKNRMENIVIAVVMIGFVVLFVGGALWLTSPWDRPSPPPSPSPTGPSVGAQITVPDVVGATNVEAIAETIREAGLVPVIKYEYRPGGGGAAIKQIPGPADLASPGDVVNVTLGVDISPPTIVSVEIQSRLFPAQIGEVDQLATVADVDLAWEQNEAYVTSWRVLFFKHICHYEGQDAGYLATGVGVADTTRFRATRLEYSGVYPFVNCPSEPEIAYVAAVDDFGNVGPLSEAVHIKASPS